MSEEKAEHLISFMVGALLHAVGKLALYEGESWRLDHPELMDAYNALQELRRETNET